MCLPTRENVAYESARGGNSRSVSPRPVAVDDDDDEPRVTFGHESENQVHVVSTTLSRLSSLAERHQFWYNKDDIKEFRREAQVTSQRLREGSSCTAEEESRGLELRSSLQRQDRKQMIVRRILDAQDDDATPEEMAQIAQQHSMWSRKLALAQAHKDYYAAYHPNLTSVLPEMPALLDCGIQSNKRTLLGTSSLEQRGRRVRCRMF